jgi:hypothetical protein
MQRGGAMKAIGPLVPDITGPEKLDELCEFNLIAAHGEAIRKSIMIVPENTFILFMGPAGFSIGSTHITEQLITHGGNSGDKRASYMEGMFTTFVEGSDDYIRPYPNAFVYTPGDLLYDTKIIMNAAIGMDSLFRVGMYELPVKEIDEFGQGAPRYAVPVIIKAMQADPALKVEIEATLNPAIKGAWDEIYAARTDAEILAKYMEARDKDESFKDLQKVFTDGSILFEKIIKPYMDDRKYGNKLDMEDRPLSQILHKYKSSKKYRFIVVATCRMPDIDITSQQTAGNNDYYPLKTRGIIDEVAPRKQMRRMSFAAKAENIMYCYNGRPSRPMNLSWFKDMIEKELRDPLFYDRSKGLPSHMRKLLMYLRDTFFHVSGSNAAVVLRYKPTIKVVDFVLCIESIGSITLLDRSTYDRYDRIINKFLYIVYSYSRGTVANNDPTIEKPFYRRALNMLQLNTRKVVPTFKGRRRWRQRTRRT